MMEYLLFRLYGPMAAWGDIAVGEQRPSHGQPSKSAVMGLLAAALGIRREEEERHDRLNSEVGFAVRVDAPGELLRDYHTTQVPPRARKTVFYTRQDELTAEKLNTILSQRDYRTDACYTVALWLNTESDSGSLQLFKQALQQPKFVLYLGRKSCPLALPLVPQIVQAKTLKQAFDKLPVRGEFLQYLPEQNQTSYFWERIDFSVSGFSSDALRWTGSRRDGLLSRKRWQFTNREEHYLSQPFKKEKE